MKCLTKRQRKSSKYNHTGITEKSVIFLRQLVLQHNNACIVHTSFLQIIYLYKNDRYHTGYQSAQKGLINNELTYHASGKICLAVSLMYKRVSSIVRGI